jgi:selenocysteine lyase/cysteine desulfurase
VEEIAALAHAHGALLLVDAAQTAGVIPLDCERSGADILVFAGHKGPLGPQGVGGLWAASHVAFESPSASCEVGAGSGPGGCLPFPGTCDTGSVNLPGVAGLAAGMAWLSARREAGPGTGPRALARRLATALADLRHVTLFGGPDVLRTATISMRIEGLPIERAEAFFRERGIIVRAGSHCAAMALQAIGAPEGTIRVSFGIFNTDQDRAAILGAVADAARAG